MFFTSRLRNWLLFVRRLLVGAIILYVAVSLLLGGTSRAKPVLQILLVGWAGFLFFLSGRSPRKSTFGPWQNSSSRLEILATNLALALVLGELTLRAVSALSGQSLLTSNTLKAHQLIPGHDYGHGLTGNSLGYPGKNYPKEKPPGTFRIAALGDSFAVGPAVPFADNYLTLLEKQLPHTEVLNFGVSGTGPREYAAVLTKDVWSFQPDLILVSVFVGNDITETLPSPRHLAPQGHALYLMCQRSWHLLLNQQRQAPPNKVSADRLSGSPLSPQKFHEVEARRLEVCRQPVSETMEKKWQRVFASLQEIIQAAKKRNCEVRLVLIPDEFQVNPAVLTQALHDARLDSKDLDLTLPQKRLSAFCQKHGVPCLDLLPAFRNNPNTYAPLDTHWNKGGNHLAAREICEWLVVRGQ